jgi:polysaccharide export outer membrane protein
MKRPASTMVFLVLGMLLAATAMGQQESTPKPAAAAPAPEMAKPATTDPGYIIGAQDMINIHVWKETDFSGTFPVRPDGKISMPLLNDVQAAGFTPMQLSAELTKKLKQYVEEPRVTVIVTGMNSRRVYLMGQVGRPGAMPLHSDMTVLQALGAAGGPAQFANAKKIYILRVEEGKQVKLPFNYKEVIKGNNAEQNIVLKPGDTIVVP